MHDAFIPPLVEAKGLLAYQNDVVCNKTIDYARNSDIYVLPLDGESTFSGNVPSPGGLWQCYAIVDRAHMWAYQTLDTVVASTFKAYLTVHLQGMILLNGAWLGGIFENELRGHIDGGQQILDQMKAFPLQYDNCRTARVSWDKQQNFIHINRSDASQYPYTQYYATPLNVSRYPYPIPPGLAFTQ